MQTRFFFCNVPLGDTPAFTASIWLLYYILGNDGHVRSHDGRQPAAAKSSSYSVRM